MVSQALVKDAVFPPNDARPDRYPAAPHCPPARFPAQSLPFACSSSSAPLQEQPAPPRKNRGGRKQVKPGTGKRNTRERNRVRFLNACFELLREKIPGELVAELAAPVEHGDDAASVMSSSTTHQPRELSKVETLRCAAWYIRHLTELLANDDGADMSIESKEKLADATTSMDENASPTDMPGSHHFGLDGDDQKPLARRLPLGGGVSLAGGISSCVTALGTRNANVIESNASMWCKTEAFTGYVQLYHSIFASK